VQTVVATATSSSGTEAGNTGVTANGYVVARTRASVSAKLAGRIAELRVSEGSTLREGEAIARLENDDYRAQLAQAEVMEVFWPPSGNNEQPERTFSYRTGHPTGDLALTSRSGTGAGDLLRRAALARGEETGALVAGTKRPSDCPGLRPTSASAPRRSSHQRDPQDVLRRPDGELQPA
jgi:multidrug efflux pump subunit AcrA (membrane-fusion protein)